MPPRHAYWTIIVDDQPTSFRAHDVEELLPTFNRLREKHPTAQLKWFERGQLFDTRDAAREQGFGQGERRWEGPRPDRDAADVDGEGGESRPRDKSWRPGGEHRDPRQKYKDAKKAKWQQFKKNIRSRWEEKQDRRRDDDALPPPEPDYGDHTPPHGDPIRPQLKPRRNLGGPAASRPERGEWRPPRTSDRETRGQREDDRGGWRPKGPPRGDRQREDWRRDDWRRDRDDRPREFRRDDDRRGGPASPKREPFRREGGWKPKAPPRDRDRTEWKPKGPARGSERDRRDDRARESRGDRKPWGGKPAGGGARKPWGSKPGGGRKPFGSKPSGGGFRKKPFGAGPPRPRGPKKRRDDDE